MPEFLKKSYGPFTGLTWVIVIVGGVGLGYALKRFGPKSKAVGDSETGLMPADTTDPVAVGTGAMGTGAPGPQYNEGAITQSLLQQLADNPPPALTEPLEIVRESQSAALQRELLTLKEQLSGLEEREEALRTYVTETGGKPGVEGLMGGADIARLKAQLIANLADQKRIAKEIDNIERTLL